jgi:hypothetical protein
MKTLRSTIRLRWYVLAWLAFCLGVAVASPLVQPKAMNLVCSSASGIKLVVSTDEGSVKLGSMGVDCPLCLLEATPPELPNTRLSTLLPLARQPLPLSCVPVVVATAAPPPARAPPFFLS